MKLTLIGLALKAAAETRFMIVFFIYVITSVFGGLIYIGYDIAHVTVFNCLLFLANFFVCKVVLNYVDMVYSDTENRHGQ